MVLSTIRIIIKLLKAEHELRSFVTTIRFDSDPFLKTNADEEERLEEYFIAPPFFNAVYGSYDNPKSSIVFAPRGGGKTALKRKIELSSINQPFLCVTYNQFDTVNKKLTDIDINYHTKNIRRLILVALLTAIQKVGIAGLTTDERHILYLLVKENLFEIEHHQLKNAINSVQNFQDTAKEWWNKFTGPIGIVINALLEKIGLGSAEIAKFKEQGGSAGNIFQQFEMLRILAQKIGYGAIYVLVDKIDETDLTGTAEKSFQFIYPLLSNLQLLELPNYSFKFFLWDLLIDSYRDIARPDRVKYYRLDWKAENLEEMLASRVNAYSGGRLNTLHSIADFQASNTLDRTIAFFSNESPRNSVRICKSILDHQSEIDDSSSRISDKSINLGMKAISADICNEIYRDSVINDLKKLKECDFTIKRIYSDVFKISQQAALKKIQIWENCGAVINIGTIQETKGVRPSNLYGLSSPLLAKLVFQELSVSDFVNQKMKVCNSCGKILLRDWGKRDSYLCHDCQNNIC
jgi:hypothetical protein